jgi:hypothetical protein
VCALGRRKAWSCWREKERRRMRRRKEEEGEDDILARQLGVCLGVCVGAGLFLGGACDGAGIVYVLDIL